MHRASLIRSLEGHPRKATLEDRVREQIASEVRGGASVSPKDSLNRSSVTLWVASNSQHSACHSQPYTLVAVPLRTISRRCSLPIAFPKPSWWGLPIPSGTDRRP